MDFVNPGKHSNVKSSSSKQHRSGNRKAVDERDTGRGGSG